MSYYERWLAAWRRCWSRRPWSARGAGRRPPRGGRGQGHSGAQPRAGPSGAHPVRRPAEEVSAPRRFAPVIAVRARNIHPTGYTRLPRYARGKTGVIAGDRGVHLFADANAEGPRRCASGSTACGSRRGSYGARPLPRPTRYSSTCGTATLTPPEPNADERVFAEPWEAQIFALAVELGRGGAFAPTEWSAALGAELSAAADDTTPPGCRRWRDWLSPRASPTPTPWPNARPPGREPTSLHRTDGRWSWPTTDPARLTRRGAVGGWTRT